MTRNASASNTVRTAPALIAEVDAAVRSVLAMQGPQRGAGAGRPGSCGGIFAGRLFALRHAEAIADAVREVQLAPGTVVTPLARDRLKQRGIALRQVAGRGAVRAVHAGEWAFANEGAAESGLVAALRRALLEEAWAAIEAPPPAAARWVAEAPHRGALVVTDEASVAVWRACQIAGVRAACADEPDAVDRAVRHLGINLLVVEPPGKSISWIRQLCATFRRAGAPRRPEAIDDTREGCACGSPR
jgi:hypothetical protein